jgi:ABC-type transporter lipoprotein component MlaA
LAIVLSTSLGPISVRAESVQKSVAAAKPALGRPVLVDSAQLKQLVTDVNEFSGAEQSAAAKAKNQIDIYEAEELYIVKILDPYADVNKVFSDVNAQVYRLIKTPAEIYATNPVIAPVRLVVTGVTNVVANVDELLIGSVSNLAVGNFADAGKSFGRSIFNLAFGLGGMIDTASIIASTPVTDDKTVEEMDIGSAISNSLSFDAQFLKQPEIHSFNDVLREWGFGCGFYLVFPVLGPQTARQVTGKVAEMPLRVDTYVPAASVLRIVSNVHQSLESAHNAKVVLEELDLSTDIGKEQFYNTLRLATLSTNKCIDESAVRDFAKEQGKTITEIEE